MKKLFTIELFSCDLNDFMEELSKANIAMKFAVKYPNRVKALDYERESLHCK